MGVFAGGPKAPPPPKPGPPPPTPVDPAVIQARTALQAQSKSRRRAASGIITGPQGLPNNELTSGRSLLGG